jgi:hypothetical protein
LSGDVTAASKSSKVAVRRTGRVSFFIIEYNIRKIVSPVKFFFGTFFWLLSAVQKGGEGGPDSEQDEAADGGKQILD